MAAELTPLPATEEKLCPFVSYLAKEKLKHRSIRTYMSAVHHLQIGAGFPDPFGQSLHMPRLEYVLKGIKRVQAEEGSTIKERLPITPHILRRLREVWAPKGDKWDTKMIWAAATYVSLVYEGGRADSAGSFSL